MNAAPDKPAPHPRPRVVILGGGFAGLRAAQALRSAAADITLIDRNNHHLFQPLLYQVATASLSPADIAAPIRQILKKQRNARVLLAEAASIDTARRVVRLSDGGEEPFDHLIIGVGARNWYFGRDQWAAHAPGLKDAADALAVREKFLLSFEAAEREPDAGRRRAILTFVVIGGGPTGVELAGAMAEIARRAIPREFRRIDTTTARIILLEGGPRLLDAFPEHLSARARRDLEAMGVEVWTDSRVTSIDDHAVTIGEERIVTRNVFWAAGVRASPLAESLGVPLDRAGRVMVGNDLSIPGHPNVFVVGDLACVNDAKSGAPVPGVAPAAMQMGTFVGRLLAREIAARTRGEPVLSRPAFVYRDKGNLATIGRARAVGVIAGRGFAGFPAWALWLAIHIVYLIGFRNRVLVLLQWAWAYFRYERGARLITQPSAERVAKLRGGV